MVNIGIDLHKTQFTICVRSLDGNFFDKYPTTDEGYQKFLTKIAAFQQYGEEVRVGVESTGNTRYFKNRMEAVGVGVTVINTLKMKVVNESVKKTDKHDAATIAEFLEKDMLPESRLCSRENEKLRRLLKVRTTLVRAQVVIKNQIHALLTAEGLEDVSKASLKSKKGRQGVSDALAQWENELEAQPLFDTIDRLEEEVKKLEKRIRTLMAEDRTVQLLMTIPGCGEISAWTIRAWTDDIKRFASPKKYAAYAGLAPWVQNSNEAIHHGRITKRGPKELRTALVQVVQGMLRMQDKLISFRLVRRYQQMKQTKGSGKGIVATARKIATVIWHMLSEDTGFSARKMIDEKLEKKSEEMSGSVNEAQTANNTDEKTNPGKGKKDQSVASQRGEQNKAKPASPVKRAQARKTIITKQGKKDQEKQIKDKAVVSRTKEKNKTGVAR